LLQASRKVAAIGWLSGKPLASRARRHRRKRHNVHWRRRIKVIHHHRRSAAKFWPRQSAQPM